MWAVTFRLGRHFRLPRHRDPAPVRVYHIVQVKSSLLHFSGTDELPKESTLPIGLLNTINGDNLGVDAALTTLDFSGFFPMMRLRCLFGTPALA